MSKLPQIVADQFDPSRYDAASNWKAAEWGNALAFRLLLAQPALSTQVRNPSPQQVISALLEYPLGVEPMDQLVLNDNWLGKFISEPTIYDIWRTAVLISRDAEVSADCIERDKQIASGVELSLDQGNSLIDHSINTYPAPEPAGVHGVLVDLNVPDWLLIESFQAWLEAKRRQRNVTAKKAKKKASLKQAYSQADFANWSASRVLAYIDLKMLLGYFDTRLTKQKIGLLLFPDDFEINLADRVSKVVEPWASMLMEVSTINSLLAQAATEAKTE